MTTHTLFVCTSCSATIAHENVSDDTVTEGVLLLNQLQELQKNHIQEQLNIQSVGCLWTCDRPCSVSIVCPNKYTYHFADVPDENSAEDLLKVCQLYIDSEDGYILPAKLPRSLRSKLLVRIPPPVKNDE
jgi:predicted metal-binding protein